MVATQTNYQFSGGTYIIIKSFSSGWSIRVVVNDQSSVAQNINVGVAQRSLLSGTLLLLSVRIYLGTFSDSYVDDATVYGHI